MRRFVASMLVVAGSFGAVSGDAKAALVVSLEAPNVQASTVSGVMTESFNSYSTGLKSSISSSIGNYTSGSQGIAIVAPDSYGGSNTSQYVAIGAQSHQTSMTLTLNSPQSYFGFEWLAGDNQNVIKFYNGSSLVGTFNVGDLISFINTQSNSSAYYGNPNNRSQDSNEPFAYVDVTGTDGTQFTSIVFQNNSSGSGFETDNHSIRSTAPTTTPGTPVLTIPAVPEPSSIVLSLILGLGSLKAFRSRRASA
ncbi:Npun_F0296 family exosortase-dependent surface protein [Singulisphaera rosea]